MNEYLTDEVYIFFCWLTALLMSMLWQLKNDALMDGWMDRQIGRPTLKQTLPACLCCYQPLSVGKWISNLWSSDSSLQAECCSDKVHCCPSGYTCDASGEICNKGSLTVPSSGKLESTKLSVKENVSHLYFVQFCSINLLLWLEQWITLGIYFIALIIKRALNRRNGSLAELNLVE